MKMLSGPFVGRFYGSLPPMYQYYLLTNIEKIQNLELQSWLKLHSVNIKRSIAHFNTVYIMQQMKLMEGLCGQEFQSGSNESNKTTKTNDIGGLTAKSKLPAASS